MRADGEQALDLPSGNPALLTPYGELPYSPLGNTHRRAIWLGEAWHGPEWEGIEDNSMPFAFLSGEPRPKALKVAVAELVE